MSDDTIYNTLQKGQALVSQYLSLLDQREEVNDKVEKIKKQISDYCEENNTKGIKSKDKLLRLSKKLKTVFPKKGRKGRKEIMDIMRKSDEWKEAVKFDVIKLGISYDKGKLSKELMLKLKPFIKKEEAVRLYVSSLTKKKKKKD